MKQLQAPHPEERLVHPTLPNFFVDRSGIKKLLPRNTRSPTPEYLIRYSGITTPPYKRKLNEVSKPLICN